MAVSPKKFSFKRKNGNAQYLSAQLRLGIIENKKFELENGSSLRLKLTTFPNNFPLFKKKWINRKTTKYCKRHTQPNLTGTCVRKCAIQIDTYS